MVVAAEVTALDIFTLAVATVGAITGIVALVVEGVRFSRSGPVLRVELHWAWVHQSGVGAITGPGKLRPPPDPTYNRFYFAVEVRNIGRAATTIEKAQIRHARRRSLLSARTQRRPEVPYAP